MEGQVTKDLRKKILPFLSSLPKVKWTKPGEALLKQLLADIEESGKIWRTMNATPISASEPDKMFIIPPEVRDNISQSWFTFHQEVKWKERSFRFHLSSPRLLSPSEKKRRIQKMVMWLIVATKRATSPPCPAMLNIFCFFSDLVKTAPTESLQKNNINTAFTMKCTPANQQSIIYLFREEEWFRAFVHETFHHFGLDFIRLNQETNEIQKRFHINQEFEIYETYCETWAETIQHLFFCFFRISIRKTRKKRNILTAFNQSLHYDRVFSLFQNAKVLRVNKLKYDDFFTRENKVSNTTQWFSYYVLKCICMVHIDEFIDFCATTSASIQFLMTQENLQKFSHFLVSRAQSVQMTKGMAMAETTDFGSSLRMTILDFV